MKSDACRVGRTDALVVPAAGAVFVGCWIYWNTDPVVTVGEGGIAVDLRQEGLGSVLRDMMAPRQTEACA